MTLDQRIQQAKEAGSEDARAGRPARAWIERHEDEYELVSKNHEGVLYWLLPDDGDDFLIEHAYAEAYEETPRSTDG